jgi:ABC-type nitrate/sulfonate/bicarbonate transport system permease component
MAAAVGIAGRPRAGIGLNRITAIRIATIVVLLGAWEVLARSGLLYKDVVPTLDRIALGIWQILTEPSFYSNFAVTGGEIVVGLAIGSSLGIVFGLAVGASPFMSRSFEPLVYYLGPTPKIIFFPVLLMWFGVGMGSKIAMGSISSFFPIALSVASGMRHIDPALIRVGKSFRANHLQMAMKIYLPAMREPVINGMRLAFGVSVIGVLLAETKLSREGLGFMVIRFYQQFDMPAMYGLVIIIFVVAIVINALLGRFGGSTTL